MQNECGKGRLISLPAKGTNQTKKQIEPKTMQNKNQFVRDSLKAAVKDLREIRRSKSCSTLMGFGHTVAIKGGIYSLRQWVEGADSAYNFTATWNRHSIFWSKDGAAKNLDRLRKQRPTLKLEVIHHDDLRSRHEKHALFVLQSFFPLRNK